MKKTILISVLSIVILLAVGVLLVACDNVPSGDTTWEVNSNISGSFSLKSEPNQVYLPYNGETGAEGDIYVTSHKIALQCSKDASFSASAVVTATKDDAAISLDGKTFNVEVVDADGNTVNSLKANEPKDVIIKVTFPDLSDESFQGCKFSIKVTLDPLA